MSRPSKDRIENLRETAHLGLLQTEVFDLFYEIDAQAEEIERLHEELGKYHDVPIVEKLADQLAASEARMLVDHQWALSANSRIEELDQEIAICETRIVLLRGKLLALMNGLASAARSSGHPDDLNYNAQQAIRDAYEFVEEALTEDSALLKS